MYKEQFDLREVARQIVALALGVQEGTPEERELAVDILKKALWEASAALKRDFKSKEDEANK